MDKRIINVAGIACNFLAVGSYLNGNTDMAAVFFALMMLAVFLGRID